MPQKPKLKLMVCSTVIGFKPELNQICGSLKGYGYTVLNSHYGTIRSRPGQSTEDACLEAVENCDLVFAIMRTRYGSGITEKEICRAIALGKPIWCVADHEIGLYRQLLKQFLYEYDPVSGLPVARKLIPFRKTSVLENLQIIDLYNLYIQDHLPAAERRNNWVQTYQGLDEILRYLETNLKDVSAVRQDIQSLNP